MNLTRKRLFYYLGSFFGFVLFYLVNCEWGVININDWLLREVKYNMYFSNKVIQPLLPVVFIFGVAVSGPIPSQIVVRLADRQKIAQYQVRQIIELLAVFLVSYWVMPWLRFFQFVERPDQFVDFLLLWSGQVIVAGCWILMIVLLGLMISTYFKRVNAILGNLTSLMILLTIAWLIIPNSIISDVTFMIFLPNQVTEALILLGMTVLTSGVICVALYYNYRYAMRKKEWLG